MIRNVSVLLAGKLKLTKYPTLKDLHCSSYQYTVVEPLPRCCQDLELVFLS